MPRARGAWPHLRETRRGRRRQRGLCINRYCHRPSVGGGRWSSTGDPGSLPPLARPGSLGVPLEAGITVTALSQDLRRSPGRSSPWLGAGLVLALALGSSPAGAAPATVLGAAPDEKVAGQIVVGVRDGAGAKVDVVVEGQSLGLKETGRFPSHRFQTLHLFVDTSNASAGRIDQLKANIVSLARGRVEAQLKDGDWKIRSEPPPIVVVADDKGNAVELRTTESVQKLLEPMVAGWKAAEGTPTSPISAMLPKALGTSDGKGWAVVFSNLCAPETDAAPDLGKYGAPVRVLYWDDELPAHCAKGHANMLAGLQGKAELVQAFRKETVDAQRAALTKEPHAADEFITVGMVAYAGGPFTAEVKAGDASYALSLAVEQIPQSWDIAAREASAAQTKKMLGGALVVLLLGIAGFVVLKARGAAAEVERWEAVGAADEVTTNLDPDAWNATIFQLTGAMPVLKEVREAAQLGPAKKEDKKADPPKEEPKKTAEVGARTSEAAPVPASAMPPSTGMTVTIPVLDDGTAYEAEMPCEIGVLLSGKAVARKTKKFRKVFSVGRATDNRVVIQKDDTVHRYHVVVRPAMQGKEWWVEVSPTATNRTNLNGKDLRPGARYKLPAKFRLQLGEATEVRGRIEAGADGD